jgi:CheY-like chemotaxis protein
MSDEKKKVLVIDDDQDVRDMCRIVLEGAGLRVECAADAAEGKRMAASESPDVIILDIMMEEADSGLRLAEALHRELPAVPVMLLSSIVDAGAQVFDLGSVPVARCLNKPLTAAQLVAETKALLARKP